MPEENVNKKNLITIDEKSKSNNIESLNNSQELLSSVVEEKSILPKKNKKEKIPEEADGPNLLERPYEKNDGIEASSEDESILKSEKQF